MYVLQMILSSLLENIFEGKNLVIKPGKTQYKTLITIQSKSCITKITYKLINACTCHCC